MTGAESSGASLAAGSASAVGALTDLGNMSVGFLNFGLQKRCLSIKSVSSGNIPT